MYVKHIFLCSKDFDEFLFRGTYVVILGYVEGRIEQFIKHIKKEGKSNCMDTYQIIQKDIVTDEVGVPNDVLV